MLGFSNPPTDVDSPFVDFNHLLPIRYCGGHVHPPVSNRDCCVTAMDPLNANVSYASSSYDYSLDEQIPESALGHRYCHLKEEGPENRNVLFGYRAIMYLQLIAGFLTALALKVLDVWAIQ
jgi:hypothetical protein